MNKIKFHRLDNGLKIYFYKDPRKHSTIVNLITKFGGMTKDFCSDNKNYHICDGMAHLLEHYVVEASSKGDYTKILGQYHMSSNASTSMKSTQFYFETTSNLKFGIKTLLECCYNPNFNQDNLEKVKKPIYQEIRMLNDNKFYDFNIATLDAVFSKYSYRSIIGNLKDIKKVNLSQLEACYKTFYQPKNQILIVAGNFDEQEILKHIKNIYKGLKIEDHAIKSIVPDEKEQVNQDKKIIKKDTSSEFATVTYKINISNFNNEELYYLDFYLSYFLKMSCDLTSNLYNNLVSNGIITYDLEFNFSFINNYLLVTIGSYTSDTTLLIENIINEIKNKENIFNEQKFELYKKQTIANISVRPESIAKIINPFIMNIIEYDYDNLDNVKQINLLKYSDFKKVISNLNWSNYAITIMEKEM